MEFSNICSEIRQGVRSLWYREEEHCVLCGANLGPLCPTCQKEYFKPELGRCHNCGKLVPAEKHLCDDCREGKGPQSLAQVAAWGWYTGAWRDFIHAFKFKAQPRAMEKLGYYFSEWAIHHLPPADGILAVPMHPERYAERGFNQAEVIASLLHWELGLPIYRGLERVLPTVSQVHLARKDRLHNLRGAFAVDDPGKFGGLGLWLVDDVTTTGSTLEACALALKEAGVSAVYGLCLAAGAEKSLVQPID